MCCYLKCLAKMISIAFLILSALFAIVGGNYFSALGRSLFEIDPILINLPQAIIQRYIWADFWTGVMVPILKLPSYIVFFAGFSLPLILLGIASLICQKWCTNSCPKK